MSGTMSQAPSTFCFFKQLPSELRVMIWLLATPRQTRFVLLDSGECRDFGTAPENETVQTGRLQRQPRIHGRLLGPMVCVTPSRTPHEPVSDEEGAAGSFGTWLAFPRNLRLPGTLHACRESLQVLTTYRGEGCSSARYTRMPRYVRTAAWPHYIVEMRCSFISYDDDVFIKERSAPGPLQFRRPQMKPLWPPLAVDDATTLQRKTEAARVAKKCAFAASGPAMPLRHRPTFTAGSSSVESGCLHVPIWTLEEDDAFGVFELERIRRLGVNMRNWVFRILNAHRNGGTFEEFPGLREVAVLGDCLSLTGCAGMATWQFEGTRKEWDEGRILRMIADHRSNLAWGLSQAQAEPEADILEPTDSSTTTEAEAAAQLDDLLQGKGYTGLEIAPYLVSGDKRFLGSKAW